MKVEAVNESRIMFTKDDGKQHDIKTRCIVYDKGTRMLSPIMPIGTWLNHAPGWVVTKKADLTNVPVDDIRTILYNAKKPE